MEGERARGLYLALGGSFYYGWGKRGIETGIGMGYHFKCAIPGVDAPQKGGNRRSIAPLIRRGRRACVGRL